MFDNSQADPIKALYVNAWAFGSNKLAQLVRLADSTEINAFVVDVKDDTGCLLYPSEVKVAQEIGATKCVRTRDVESRLDTLRAHDIYAIARIVVAKDPLLAERRPKWSVQNRDGSGLWRDRIGSAWVDAYNDSVWIYAAQLGQEAVRLGFNEVQFDYVRFPDEPKEAMAPAVFAARKRGETQRAGVQAGIPGPPDPPSPLWAAAGSRAPRRMRSASRSARLKSWGSTPGCSGIPAAFISATRSGPTGSTS